MSKDRPEPGFGEPVSFKPAAASTHEWLGRLKPAAHSAAHGALGWELAAVDQALVDPLTALPVVKRAGGTILTVAPLQLPAGTKGLRELVLADGQAWVRSHDGLLFLAPRPTGSEIFWGRPGGGPRMLALVIQCLLDDVRTDFGEGPVAGAVVAASLQELFEKELSEPSLVPRDQLANLAHR
jgi:hypothetical protein